MPEFSSVLDMPDVFFEVANENRRPATTLLYSLEPKGIGTGQCESLKSYICRLANLHRVSLIQLVSEVLWSLIRTQQKFGYQHRRRGFTSSEWIVSTGIRTSSLVEALSTATGNSMLHACTMLPVGRALNTRELISESDRYCPECIAQHSNVYDAYGQLLWAVRAVAVCPIHGVRLIQHKCGMEGRRSLAVIEKKWLPGSCMSCGSIGFRCSVQPRQQATDVEIWRASQVAALIAYFPNMAHLFSQESLMRGLRNLFSEYADGKLSVAARRAGIHKSVLWGWVHGQYLPTIGMLLDLCLSAKVSLVSVLTGAPVSCMSPDWGGRPPRIVNRKPSRSERENALRKAMLAEPPRSFNSIAAQIGITCKRLQIQFPELTRMVTERFRQSQQNQFARKQKEAAALAVKLAQELRAKKVPLTWRNLREASGEQLLPHSRLRHELKQLLSEEKALAI